MVLPTITSAAARKVSQVALKKGSLVVNNAVKKKVQGNPASGIFVAANDNFDRMTGGNTFERGQVDATNVVVGPFGQRNKVVDPNKLEEETARTYSGPVKDLIERPTEVRRLELKKDKEEKDDGSVREGKNVPVYSPVGVNTDNDNYIGEPALDVGSDGLERQREQISKVRSELEKEKIFLSDSDVLSLSGSKFKVKFPWIMFCVTFMYEFIGVVVGLISILFTVIVPPIGFMSVPVTAFTGFVGMVVFFLWSNYYAENCAEYARRVPMLRRFIIRRIFTRGWFMLARAIPYLGNFLPVGTFLVWYSYHYETKRAKKIKKVFDKYF
jgi:hypothetical protein